MIQIYITYALAAAAISLLAAVAMYEMSRYSRLALNRYYSSKSRKWIFLTCVSIITLYGGTKPATIIFPTIDTEVRYLYDNGSYVTNDTVRVSFNWMIAPSSAPLLIDYRQLDLTNDTDWVSFTNTTIEAFNQPQTFQFPNASNYNWIVYTTWTQGPTVQTNGVWHAYWGLDKKENLFIIPVRSCVMDMGSVIATPKSKWSSTNSIDEVTNEE